MLRSTSIRAKLIAIIMVTTCVSLLIAGLALAIFEFVSNRSAKTKELATVADIIGVNCTAALIFNDARATEETLAALGPQPDVLEACLYDDHHSLFASYLRRGARPSCPRAPEADGEVLAGGALVRSSGVMLGRQRVGTLRLVASLGDVQRRLEVFGLMLLAVITFSGLTALLISARLQRLVSRPILDLAETATRVSNERDYTLRAPQHTEDEIGVAVTAFNQMLERIQDGDAALRQAGEKSREQAQLLRSILDNMGEGMVACDLSGKFLLWNPAATRLIGHGTAQLDVRDWPRHFGLYREDGKTLFDSNDLPLVRAIWDEAVTDRELYVRPPSQENGRWISTTARPLRDDRGRLRGGIAVFRDVTEQKRAEAELRASETQLRQAQKMEAVGRLAGGIAHDFNNLLTAISGYSILALEHLRHDDPVRSDIEEVHKAGERAAALTHQLLAFSRKQVLEPKPLDLNAVVLSMDKMLRRLIAETITLVFSYAPDLAVVKADLNQVEQIVLNLVVNARDAMPNGGKLIIETANAELDEPYARTHVDARPGSYVLLTVSDTGVGMDAETQARIFEPFFSTKEPGKGTGLGLSTVYGIAQQSGGHVAVYSEVGRGTTFKIYLPRSSEPLEAMVGPVGPMPVPRGTETILVVEDDEFVRALARDSLTALGYTVLAVTDGVEALELEERHHGSIHLVITDVVMPRMNGPELAKRLARLAPGVGVLFVSGYTGKILQQGFLGYEPAFLQKPFTPAALARKAREVLDRILR